MKRVRNEEDAVLFARTAMWGCCVLFAMAAPLAAGEESCCREVPWGTVTVAVHDARSLGETREGANHYLLTDKEYGGFELTLKAIISGGNSGIYFRSHREPGSVDAHGYQYDVGGGLWGMLYDERGTRIVGISQRSMPPGFNPNEWVECRIRCVGPRIQYWLNGHKTLDYVEQDTQIPRRGNVGLQFHSWPAHPFKACFKDIQIKELQ